MSQVIQLETSGVYSQHDGHVKPGTILGEIKGFAVDVVDESGKLVRRAQLSPREICDGFRSGQFTVVKPKVEETKDIMTPTPSDASAEVAAFGSGPHDE